MKKKRFSSPRTLCQEKRCQPAANYVHSSLSLTPVQNKNHDAAQVWDHNCGRLYLQNPLGWQPQGRWLTHTVAVTVVSAVLSTPLLSTIEEQICFAIQDREYRINRQDISVNFLFLVSLYVYRLNVATLACRPQK